MENKQSSIQLAWDARSKMLGFVINGQTFTAPDTLPQQLYDMLHDAGIRYQGVRKLDPALVKAMEPPGLIYRVLCAYKRVLAKVLKPPSKEKK